MIKIKCMQNVKHFWDECELLLNLKKIHSFLIFMSKISYTVENLINFNTL